MHEDSGVNSCVKVGVDSSTHPESQCSDGEKRDRSPRGVWAMFPGICNTVVNSEDILLPQTKCKEENL